MVIDSECAVARDWIHAHSSEQAGYCRSVIDQIAFIETNSQISGTGLNDSPLGLAAYILEKFSTWTNGDYRKLADGGLTK